MSLSREKLPKSMIPIFMIWIVLCNIGAIIFGTVWYLVEPSAFGSLPFLYLGIAIGINVASLLFLIPLFKMDPIKPFFVPALIWFVVVSIIYIILGLYYFLIFSVIQLLADIWFHWMLKRITK